MVPLFQVQILSMLDHPNIISYYDNFEEDGVLMIEMEYADGGYVCVMCMCEMFTLSYCRTLAQFLRQQTTPMPERDILLMFYKMVDALRYLHEHKILHRLRRYTGYSGLQCCYLQGSQDSEHIPH